jgi:formate dehydrogenase assembly factor FdhD
LSAGKHTEFYQALWCEKGDCQTSCGICGKKMIEDLNSVLDPAESGFEVEISRIFDCIAKLSENQNYYPRTRGSHDRPLQIR